MIPPETFREYIRRIDPDYKLYQKELRVKATLESIGMVWHHRTPYGRFRRAMQPHMEWLLAEVARLRGDGA